MPRASKVTVRYQKVRKQDEGIRKNRIKAQSVVMKQPRALSPLTRYIEENRESGLSMTELTQQFQEYDCDHLRTTSVAKGPNFAIQFCPDCGLSEKVDAA